MRHLEITEMMIRQSKEIWGLLEPGEFILEPGDWIFIENLSNSGFLCLIDLFYREYPDIGISPSGPNDRIYKNDECRPIFSFTHCLDLLQKRGLFYSISHLHGDLVRMKVLLPGDKVLNAIGINYHECAQAVLLKVLKGGE